MQNDKRKNYFDWDEVFMQMARVIANRSKDPNTQNGACLVNDKNIVIGLGYNGFPRGCSDDFLPWTRDGEFCNTKYAYVAHAEENAILNTSAPTEGSKLYCTLYPCNECVKILLQKGIKEIIYEGDKYHDDPRWVSSRRMIELSGIKTRQYIPKNRLTFKSENLFSLPIAEVFIHDEFNPQDMAMMQALYSRSPQSVTEHVEKVKQTGSGKFMETFYVGYGHASIADCGSTTVFIEKLSILADKAIQDWPLYSGQETSTRYVDMAKQPIIDPLASDLSRRILENWMGFYVLSLPKMEEYLIERYPRRAEESENIYKKAIKARAFDVLRGFLPAGITTQLSWHTNLRQAYDKLCVLRHNPLSEVRQIAEKIFRQLNEKYPQSFCQPVIDEQEKYRKEFSQKYNFFVSENPVEFEMKTNISAAELEKYQDILDSRPPKTGLPHFLSELGTITFSFFLDYGSFRDIQRHRNGVCRIPLLTAEHGFNDWYLGELSDGLREKALTLIGQQKQLISELNCSSEIRQYYMALGFNATCRVSYGLPAAVYVTELRSAKAVHPTLRRISFKMRESLLKEFPFLKLNCDLEPAVWEISRGLHDIIKK